MTIARARKGLERNGNARRNGKTRNVTETLRIRMQRKRSSATEMLERNGKARNAKVRFGAQQKGSERKRKVKKL